MKKVVLSIFWFLLAIAGAWAYGTLAFHRGEELFVGREAEGRVDSGRFSHWVRAVESIRPACRGASEYHLELATEEPGVVGARQTRAPRSGTPNCRARQDLCARMRRVLLPVQRVAARNSH